MIRAQGLPLFLAALLFALWQAEPADACCPAPPSGSPVVNADQTVIVVWDPATKVQHFIRRASFKSAADDFGFLVPTPSQPELSESGDDAFPLLQKLTAPEVIRKPRPSESGCGGCLTLSRSKSAAPAEAAAVTVLEEKTVAGFDAVVLEAESAGALIDWLKDHGYAFSPEVEAWAKPYVDDGWKITALQVAKDKEATGANSVAASALHMAFKTDRPLFPYREPDTSKSASTLGASSRLLRIYFVGGERYRGELTEDHPWTGKVAWAGKLDAASRDKLAAALGIPPSFGPSTWWLTEFEDPWPYAKAPADLTFVASADPSDVRREPIIEYTTGPSETDAPVAALGCVILPLLLRRVRRRRHPGHPAGDRAG